MASGLPLHYAGLAGYTTIMERVSASEKEFRLAHLKDIMYFATQYEWENVLTFHSACLFEIECGRRRWGDAFLDLVPTTLAGAILRKKDSRSSVNSINSSKYSSQASINNNYNNNYNRSRSNSNLNSSSSNSNSNNNSVLWCKE